MTLAITVIVGSALLTDVSATPVQIPTPSVVAAIPHWDSGNSLDSLHDRARGIDVAAPFFYTVGVDGSVRPEPSSDIDITRILETRSYAKQLEIIPSVANTSAGEWDGATISRILRDPDLRITHIESLTALASYDAFDGVQIDYEDLYAEDRELFSSFISDLSDRIRSLGKVLYVTVHPKENDAGYDERNLAQDYAAIGRSADKVVVMAYDRHWESSPPGPIAPYGWVNNVVQYATSQIPHNKVLLGIPLYGYDWVGTTGTPLTWREAKELSAMHSASETWDPVSRSTHFSYRRDGVDHDVWFGDARSVRHKVALAQQYRLAGVFLWRLGGEDPAIWEDMP